MRELQLTTVFDINAHIEILRYVITTDKAIYDNSAILFLSSTNRNLYDVIHVKDTTARYIIVVIVKDQELTLRGDV